MNSLYNYLAKKSIINSEEIEVVIYGMKAFILNLSTILSTLFIAHIFHNIFYGICFLLSFVPIRIIMGGYHCHTPLRCFIVYNFIISILFFEDFQNISIYSCLILLIVLFFIPCYINSNKQHLDTNTFNRNKRIVLLINLIFLIALKDLFISPIFISEIFNIFLLCLAYINDYFN